MSRKRREEILSRLRAAGYLSVSRLAAEYDVDTSTIRRDLAALEAMGLATRSYGGATPGGAGTEVPFDLKVETQVDQKRAIGERVAELLAESGSVILDSGSTMLAVAKALTGQAGKVVITHDLRVGTELVRQGGTRVIVLGGEVMPDVYSLVGERSVAELRQYDVDVAVLAADAVDENGFSITNNLEAAIKRAMIASARRVIIAADSSKIGRSALVRVAGLEEVDLVVTDDGLHDEVAARLPVEVVRVSLI